MIPYGKQSIDADDVEAVVSTLGTDFLTCGPKVQEFEEKFASYCGVKHAVACSNGTAALHLAMLAGGVGCGDSVVTSPITFLASANAGRYVGAQLWFGDVDSDTATLCPDFLRQNWRDGTKAIVAVDYAGNPADLASIRTVADEFGALVIEDACHATGGKISMRGEEFVVGGCPFSDISTFSFHPVKTMTTGEGGMVTTNDDEIASRARLFRNHGMTRDIAEFSAFGSSPGLEEVGPWAYEMQQLGFNYRLTDMQCALGISQLSKLDGFVRRRREIVDRYNEEFRDLEFVEVPEVGDWVEAGSELSWHLYAPRFDFESLGLSRADFMKSLSDLGVASQVHYIPVHKQPYYQQREVFHLPRSEEVYSKVLSLPLYPDMKECDVSKVVEAIKSLCASD